MRLVTISANLLLTLTLLAYFCERIRAESEDEPKEDDESSQEEDKSNNDESPSEESGRDNHKEHSRGSSEVSNRHGSSHSRNRYVSDEYGHHRNHRRHNHHEGYGTPTCADQSKHCELRQNLCIAEWAFEEMARDCARTCNRCHGDLLDISEHCRLHAHQCQQDALRDLMGWQCPYTCGYSHHNRPRPRGKTAPFNPNAVANNNCVDKNECTFWGQAFCQSPYYNMETKRVSCPRMCGLCSFTIDYFPRLPYKR